MTRQALNKVAVCTALLAALAVTGITRAQSAVNTSPYLNGVLTQDPNCVSDPLFQRMFNGRGGWLVIPVYEYVTWQADGRNDPADMQWGLRVNVQAAADAGYCVILRLYWKQDGAAGPAGAPPGQWCIPPENDTTNRDEFASWCRDVVNVHQACCTHYIIGNEPNQEGEHGGSGCFVAAWYSDVFQACQSQMLSGTPPDTKVIVAGITPGDTGCQSGDDWKYYIQTIAAQLGTSASYFAIHNNGNINQNSSPLDRAFQHGQFEEYIMWIGLGRGTTSGCQYYIDETNPFLHGSSVGYPESWLIHLFDQVTRYNDFNADPAYYGYRPIQCVCYYCYFIVGWNHYNLADNATTANQNHNLNVAAEKDFPLLIHRNNQPRPAVNLVDVMPPGTLPYGYATDGYPTTKWDGGLPWNDIAFATLDGQEHSFERVLAWVYQGVDNATTEVTANADPGNPNATVDCRCELSANSEDLYIWTPDDLDRTALAMLRLTINNDTFAHGLCHNNITETNMGWYEVRVYPPAEAVAGGGVGPARQIHMIAPPTVSQLTSTSAVVSWQTDVPSTTRVDLDPGSSPIYDGALTTSHSVTLTGLQPNSVYRYAATSTKPGYGPAYAEGVFVTKFPITITNILVDNITQTSARIRWTTNVASTSRVDYGTTDQYGQYVYNASQVTSHVMMLTGLSPGTTYHYKVTSTRSGYHGASGDLTFTTSLPPITISNISVDNITNTSARVRWTTNVPSTSWVKYGTTDDYGQRVGDDTYVVNHAIWLTGLSAGTTYHYRVSSERKGYQAAVSEDQTFTTATGQVPLTISEIEATPYIVHAIITWTTNVPSTSMVQYRVVSGGISNRWQSVSNGALVNSHSITLTGLSSGTTYDYRVTSAAVGYGSVTSGIYQFTTYHNMPH